MNEHEEIGKLYLAWRSMMAKHDNLVIEYNRVLGLVDRIKKGEVKPEDVTVDLQANTWNVNLKPMEKPAESPAA